MSAVVVVLLAVGAYSSLFLFFFRALPCFLAHGCFLSLFFSGSHFFSCDMWVGSFIFSLFSEPHAAGLGTGPIGIMMWQQQQQQKQRTFHRVESSLSWTNHESVEMTRSPGYYAAWIPFSTRCWNKTRAPTCHDCLWLCTASSEVDYQSCRVGCTLCSLVLYILYIYIILILCKTLA